MPATACPTCGYSTPRLVDAPSQYAAVNYYRCDTCAAIWNTPKGKVEPISIVAEGRKPADPK